MPVKIKSWTILMQINAENNLFDVMLKVMEDLYGIRDPRIEHFDDVNFIILLDGLSAERFSASFARPALYVVKPNSSFYLEYPIDRIDGKRIKDDLTDAKTLETVYAFVKKQFPAKHYGFIYKGHGSAGEGDVSSGIFAETFINIPAALLDDESKTRKFITGKVRLGTKEIADWSVVTSTSPERSSVRRKEVTLHVMLARKNERNLTYRKIAETLIRVFGAGKFGFVFLDCCWGMQIENAYTFRNVAEYFIASADEMPASGIGYTGFLHKIVSRPVVKPREVANLLLSVYFTNRYDDYDSPIPKFRKMGVSLTNIKTGELEDFVTVFNALCDYIRSDMYRLAPLLKRARNCCLDYTYDEPDVYNMYNIDMIWFLENLQHFNAQSLKDPQLEKLILGVYYITTVKLRFGYMGNNYREAIPGQTETGGRGITLTFPEHWGYYHKGMYPDHPDIRPEFTTNCRWRLVLKDYYKHQKFFYNHKFYNKNTTETGKYMDWLKGQPALCKLMGFQNPALAGSRKKANDFFTQLCNRDNKGKWMGNKEVG